jgi:NTE family protein
MTISRVVFSAGSIGGLTFVGAWKALEQQGLTKGITEFSGCSIGAIMAMLTSIGYTASELEAMALELSYSDLSELQLLQTFERYGLDTGNEIERLLRELLFHKTGYHDMTFAQHYAITGRNLWINASCVEQDVAYYFTFTRSPDMSIIKAVRMSVSLPVIMVPVKYKGLTFIDGGMHDPYPVCMFPVDGTLVLKVCNNHNSQTGGFVEYIGMIIRNVYRRLHINLETLLSRYKVILIKTGIGGLSLDVSRSTRRKLIKIGYKTVLKNLP